MTEDHGGQDFHHKSYLPTATSSLSQFSPEHALKWSESTFELTLNPVVASSTYLVPDFKNLALFETSWHHKFSFGSFSALFDDIRKKKNFFFVDSLELFWHYLAKR